MPQSEKHILVIRLSAMGDVAMVVPVLRALTSQYKTLKISVLTKPLFKAFFKDIENVEVITADVKGKHKGFLGLYNLARTINKSYKFDAVADLHGVIRSKVLKQFISSKRTVSINKGRKEKKQLTSGEFFKPLKTTHQRYADVFEALGFTISLSNPIFPSPVKLNEKLNKALGSRGNETIGIAPFAAHDGKMYPLDLMEEVIKSLSTNYKIIFFGGGKKEIDILDNWENLYENTISVAGKLSMDEELAIISNLDVMLSMDSGNGHVAAMLGVKVITLWGVTHPYAGFAPFNQPNGYALTSDRNQFPLIPTSVYGNKYPDGYDEVMKSIVPKTVVDKIKSIL